MSDGVKIGEMEVRDQRFEVTVDRKGWFTAGGFGAKSYEELYSRLMRETKRKTVKVAIPFCVLRRHHSYSGGETSTIRYGVATGMHQGTQNVLVEWQDGAKEQLEGYGSHLKPLTPEEAREYVRLHTDFVAAQAAEEAFKKAHDLNLREAVRKAIEAQVNEEVKV